MAGPAAWASRRAGTTHPATPDRTAYQDSERAQAEVDDEDAPGWAVGRPSTKYGVPRRTRDFVLSTKCGVPNGIRTRVLALKGPRPGPLDDGDTEVGYSR